MYDLVARCRVDGEGFAGIAFAAADPGNHELVYVSPGEIQYDPVMRGSNTWQVYHGAGLQAPAPVPARQWVALRVMVRDRGVAEISDFRGLP